MDSGVCEEINQTDNHALVCIDKSDYKDPRHFEHGAEYLLRVRVASSNLFF